MRVHRVVAGLDPQHRAEFESLAQVAARLEAELMGLFVEDEDLLRFASLPFAREIGFPSAARREVDLGRIERGLRSQADRLRAACARASETCSIAWSFRVTRGPMVEQMLAVAMEYGETTLLIPPGVRADAQPLTLEAHALSADSLRSLMAGKRPVIVVHSPVG